VTQIDAETWDTVHQKTTRLMVQERRRPMQRAGIFKGCVRLRPPQQHHGNARRDDGKLRTPRCRPIMTTPICAHHDQQPVALYASISKRGKGEGKVRAFCSFPPADLMQPGLNRLRDLPHGIGGQDSCSQQQRLHTVAAFVPLT
jgi:hypothetical protein